MAGHGSPSVIHRRYSVDTTWGGVTNHEPVRLCSAYQQHPGSNGIIIDFFISSHVNEETND